MPKVTPINKKSTQSADKQPLREAFDEASETLRRGRAVLGVTLHAISEKDSQGADIGEEWVALQAAYDSLEAAEELLDNAILRLARMDANAEMLLTPAS